MKRRKRYQLRRIHNNKVYDTETARFIAGYDSDCGPEMSQYLSEDLYQKKTGEYFVCGIGGKATRYVKANHKGELLPAQLEIFPLSVEEAKIWVKKHRPGMYKRVFAEKETDEKIIVSMYLTTTLYEKGKAYAADHGISLSALIDAFLNSIEQ